MLETRAGLQPIDWVSTQDEVLTKDHGFQKVLWVGKSTVTLEHMKRCVDMRPVTIRAGALGDGMPTHDLILSPDHRILVQSQTAEMLFGSHEVLVSAEALTNGTDIGQLAPNGHVTYYHVLCEQHELLLSDGLWVESLFVGDAALRQFSRRDMLQIARALSVPAQKMVAARPSLTALEAALLVQSGSKQGGDRATKRSVSC